MTQPLKPPVAPSDLWVGLNEKYWNEYILGSGNADAFRSNTERVLRAWEHAELSEGQASKALGVSRLEARTLRELWQQTGKRE